MALHKKEKLGLLSHPYLERVLEEEDFIPKNITVDTDEAVNLPHEGIMVHIARQLKVQLGDIKNILIDREKYGWWVQECLL